MLTENDVINYLANHLETDHGYFIQKKATTSQKGIDIIAIKNGKKLCIEAKGETSSKIQTKRFGKPFTNSQVSTHISMAILYIMLEINKDADNDYAIALPDNLDHRNMICRLLTSLKQLNIKVYFVDIDGKVELAW